MVGLVGLIICLGFWVCFIGICASYYCLDLVVIVLLLWFCGRGWFVNLVSVVDLR